MIEPGAAGGRGALSFELRAASDPAWRPEPPRLRIGDVLPVQSRSDVELCGELQRLAVLESMLAADGAEVVRARAALRPAEDDLPDGAPGAASPTWGAGEVRLPDASEF